MEIIKIPVGPLKSNTYILKKGTDCILIDPGSNEQEDIVKVKQELSSLTLYGVLCTHNHFDHVSGITAFSQAAYLHQEDIDWFDQMQAYSQAKFGISFHKPQLLALKETVSLGPFSCQVIHTPGHSPGSVCFYFPEENVLFSGDTLFVNTCGRVDLPYSSPEAMKESLQRLLTLPKTTTFYPGHGWDGILGEQEDWIRLFLKD